MLIYNNVDRYKDASKTLFKSSTRLECMMQDYPRTLAPSAKVGFTVLDTWLAYAPVKNNAEDAMKASLFLLSLKVVLGQVKWFILQN
jgi:hypothetical protein